MDASKSLEAISVEAAGILAAVADPVRWRLLTHLTSGNPTCVCDLQPIAAVASNLLSYHLKVLREAGLVSTARRGRWVDYTIVPDALDRLRAALPTAETAGAIEATGAAGAIEAVPAVPGGRRPLPPVSAGDRR